MKEQTKKGISTDSSKVQPISGNFPLYKKVTPTEKALLLGSDEVIAKAIQDLLRKDSLDKSWN